VRDAVYAGNAPTEVVAQVRAKLKPLLGTLAGKTSSRPNGRAASPIGSLDGSRRSLLRLRVWLVSSP